MSVEFDPTLTRIEFDPKLVRFQGMDISYRRSTSCCERQPIDKVFVNWSPSEWPGDWRARIVTSKNERAEYRVCTFGNTAEEAVERLHHAVACIDRGEKP